MTKQQFEAKLKLLKNLSDLANSLEDDLMSDLEDLGASRNDSEITEMFVNLRNDLYPVRSLMNGLSPYLKKLEEGKEAETPEIKVEHYNNDFLVADITVTTPLKDGGKLLSTIADIDFDGTVQAFTSYENEKGELIDLCGVECKKGELAMSCGLPEDNKDIDIYTYGDPYSEDYTDKTTIAHEDIKKAFGDDEAEDELEDD